MKTWDDLKFDRQKMWNRFWHPEYGSDLFGANVYPSPHVVYRAFELTPFEKVKCVILGQDPYHTPGMAHGLAFSVPPHIRKLPPSLRNILREYQDDLGYPAPKFGDLTPWAREGVLLLNTVLTVEAGKPLSHKGMGWEKLTIEVIQKLSEYKEAVVFILWGQHAQEYKGLIDPRHNIITAPHPSPLSVNAGFHGHHPFTRANFFLEAVGQKPINWRLT